MAVSIKSTDLDFNRIKEQLKTHFLASNEFADYDFEASGLSNILDVLAYNTHYNALIANFALNESFLTTAQLRSSVLAISESLGYIPRSKTAAYATVNLSVSVTSSSRPGTLTLPAGSQFTSTVEDVSYIFQTIEDHIAVDNGSGFYQFLTSSGSPTIYIYEGVFRTKTFIADSTSTPVYIIPDDTMDTSTAKVQVYASRNAELFETYLPLASAQNVTADTRYYTLREAPNGSYEITFGDGITTGKTPQAGEVIRVTYLSTSNVAANGARDFVSQSEITVDDTDYAIAVSTLSRAAGGSDKESIKSIKANAPISYASQNRLVTANDYIALITRTFGSFLDDVTAWGGEDNVPADFGNVYVSLKFIENTTEAVKQVVKDGIVSNLSDTLSIMSIDTKFTDAVTTYIETETFFNFDPSLTNVTAGTTEGTVQTVIRDYFTTNLNKFNSTFRRSQILADIDDVNAAILNSRMDVKVQQRITPTLSQNLAYSLQYPVALAAPLTTTHTITSTPFNTNGKTCTIRNRLGSNILEVVTADGEIVITNIGTYDAAKGSVNIVSLTPTSIVGAASYIKISAVPANQSTIRPLRNYILTLDTEKSFASAQIDYQEIRVTL